MSEVLLHAEKIDKNFGVTHAVDHVTLDFFKGEIHAHMNEEIGVTYLQAKGDQRLPGNHQKLKETEQTTPSQPSEGTDTADILISNF